MYNPSDQELSNERLKEAEKLLAQIPAKYCFISGSFLYKEKYKDIDLFIITRSKKEISVKNPQAKITRIDFNDLYSLFYHSISKSCVAKTFLPQKPLKVTLADYWQVINEAVPMLLNQKSRFHKDVRSLILYTEYFKTGEILDTFQLSAKINSFKGYQEVLQYVKQELPAIVAGEAKPSYIKRFFYTQAGSYKKLRDYAAQNFLYGLTHAVAKGIAHG